MSHRRARVASDLRSELAAVLSRRLGDPRLVGVTVVEVRPSPDFSFARVFYRTLGDPGDAEAALEKAKPFIRRCLAEGSKRRRVPELDFRYDTSQERAERIENLIEEINAHRHAEGDGPAEPGGSSEADIEGDSK